MRPSQKQPYNPDSISSIAHKLRTPLTVIMSTVNNLLDGAFGRLNSDQKEWLKKLETHTTHLESLVNDILNAVKSHSIEEIDKKMDKEMVQKSSSQNQVIPVPNSQAHNKKEAPTILIVDDEADIRDIIKEGMAMKGFKTLTASNEEEALNLCLKSDPDLILMDVFLGRQNGIEACKKIKSQIQTFIPVILITGQNDLKGTITGADQSADDLLMKPFQMEELFARVTSMLRIKSLHDEVEMMRRAA